MTTVVSAIDQALALCRTLTLPDGRRLAETLPDDPWIERDILRPILGKDEAGLPLYRHVWAEIARGHWKTGAIAVVAIVEALLCPGTDIFVVAADIDQARLCIEAIDGQCRRSPKLAVTFRQSKDEFTVKNSNSRIRVMSSDAPSFYGVGVNSRRLRIYCDELTQWRTRDLYDAVLTTLPKVRDHQLVNICNAGIVGTWQEDARKAAGATGYLFAPPGVIASWIHPADLERVRQTVPSAVYRRYYENVWTDSSGDFITKEMLERCIDPELGPRLRGVRTCSYGVGLDLGLTKDRTARSICHYDREADTVTLDSLAVWQGTKEHPVVIDDIEADLEFVHTDFRPATIAADPWQLASTIQRLSRRIHIEAFTFTPENLRRLSETLFTLISAGKFRMYPDAALERELLALEARQTSYGWRIDHRPGGYSDRAMATGMAALTALTTYSRPQRHI